ncbi:MAG: PepSY domain-containing protein [Longimicrobiales bacterium]|nr:PepSY domain-containing protein [Longimicrobiales bacterium]
MKRVAIALLTASLIVAAPACSERGEVEDEAAEVEDEAAEEAEAEEGTESAAPSLAPGEEAVLVEEAPGLLARAQVSDSVARATAVAAVPGGRIVKAVIEEEDGKVVFSYDLVVEGQEGITEVLVDAATGEVVEVAREGAEPGGP